MNPRLRDKYQKEVVPALKKEFGYKNVMAVPKIQKVVVNMGLGEATSNAKLVDVGADELARITGQKPVTRRSKKSIAAFKVRKGMPIGTMVTLRGERMWEFLDRLMTIALPRVRDFKGVSPKGFDGRGNYTLGLRDQLLFTDFLFLFIEIVISAIDRDRLIGHFDNFADNAVHKITIMAGHQKRTFKAHQPLLEPYDTLKIQMIRRLVH